MSLTLAHSSSLIRASISLVGGFPVLLKDCLFQVLMVLVEIHCGQNKLILAAF